MEKYSNNEIVKFSYANSKTNNLKILGEEFVELSKKKYRII